MIILAIETSCDETACAVVGNGTKEIASELASSAELHEKTGGVVPEIAARKQAEFIIPVLESTISKTAEYFNINPNEVKNKIDALAVTVGPGLVGSLVVGIEACKTLSLVWKKPIIPVNHLIGHIYANFLLDNDIASHSELEQKNNRVVDSNTNEAKPTKVVFPNPYLTNSTSVSHNNTEATPYTANSKQGNTSQEKALFPAVVLVVSGGHTDLVLMKNHGNFEYLGGSLDDAAGEAFDKVARILNISTYLGGAKLSKVAREYTGEDLPLKLPRPMIYDNTFDFSFSGLKTAVKRLVEQNIYPIPAIAKEFESAVVDVLVEKTLRAVEKTGARCVLLGGGVSANLKLRQELVNKANEKFGANNITIKTPPPRLCTDNAIYIASAAYFNQTYKPLDQITPNPSLSITDAL